MQPPSPFSISSLARKSDAILYRGRMGEAARPVLVKVPRSLHPREAERLRNEFEIGGALAGTQVLQIIALDTFEGSPALVLEDFAGETLEEVCQQAMPVGEFLPLAVRIAGALAAVHERGVIHKNLKPDNIFVDRSTGEVRLGDFSLASLLPREQQLAGSPRLIEGSLPYLAPEQTGWMNRAVDARSDLYALGVTFYQLLTGRLPFEAHDPVEWVHCHIARVPEPPVQLLPAIPLPLSQLVMKLLAKVAEDRYQSARGVEHDLQAIHVRWHADRSADPLTLGTRDFSSSFQVTQKLYGRESQVAGLTAAFEESLLRGTPGVVLVSGYAGIGKSSLAGELRRPVVREQGFFLTGKFEELKHDVPYATIAQAFRDLALDLLARDEGQIRMWRRRIAEAVGAYGQLLVEVIPALELLIGKQPAVPELSQKEAQHRFLVAFRQLVGICARREHPLVLFLDDVQWADSASLTLLTDLCTSAQAGHLLLVGTYRDHEVPAGHPAALAFERLRRAGVPLTEMALQPLSREQVAELIADTVHAPLAQAAPLAELVHQKTGGNPFFTLQFLTALHQERLISWRGETATWHWDVERIRAKGFTDNVVDLMVGNLRRLPAATRATIELAATVGNELDADTLALLERSARDGLGGCGEHGQDDGHEDGQDDGHQEGQDQGRGRPRRRIHQDLRIAVREGLLLRQGESYRFLHDRVRQAAASLIPEQDRPGIHLRIGRLLRARLPEDPRAAPGERLFEVVNHLNRGEIPELPEERLDQARLNLAAARRARAAAAFAVGLNYATAGRQRLPADAFLRHPELAVALHQEEAEATLVVGDLDEAEARLLALLPHATRRLDRARIYRLLVDLYTRRGQSPQALAAASECLRLYHIDLPVHPGLDQVSAAESAMWAQLPEGRLEALVDAPLLCDPDLQAAADVLTFLLPTAYFTDPLLHRLICIHLVDLTLQHGVMAASPMGFASFGLELCISGRYTDADRFGTLACGWVDRHRFPGSRPTAYMISGAGANAYNHPYRSSLPLFREAFQAGLEVGDLLFASFCSNFMTLGPYLCGNHLEEVANQAQASVDFLRRAHYEVFVPPVASVLNLARGLRDGGKSTLSLDGPDLSEAVFEAEIEPRTLPIISFGHNLFKLKARYFQGDFGGAAALAGKVGALAFTMRGQMAEVEAHVFCGLALAAAEIPAPGAAASPSRGQRLGEIRGHRDWLADKAAHCPENFLARHALLSAELARVEGRLEDAALAYEQAIGAARSSELRQYQALGNELAGRFHLARGLHTPARGYLEQARDGYARWGAEFKVRQLGREFPVLVERRSPVDGGTLTWPAEQFDVLSVTKASQAISGQIVLDDLVASLVCIALEQAGAERALVILARDGELYVEAEATLGRAGTEVRVLQGIPLQPEALPVSVARFAWRTREPVILDFDAHVDEQPGSGNGNGNGNCAGNGNGNAMSARGGRFAADPYFTEAGARPGSAPSGCKGRPRSMLCLPVVRESVVVGLIYLENRVLSGVFTGGRLAALQLLAAQAAISIENARLLRRAEEATRLRDEFLSVASHELNTPMTSLILSLQGLLNGANAATPNVPMIQRMATLAERQGKRLSRLVHDLLDVTRIERGALEVRPEEVELGALVRESVSRARPQLTQAGCEVRIEAPEPLSGQWDPQRLDQVVMNLLANAAKFGAGKPVQLVVTRVADRARLTVTDQGIGIDGTQQARIFDRFSRAVSALHYGGLGLGLYICRRVLDAHGGTIQVVSQPGQGATFIVELPLPATPPAAAS